MMCLIIAHHYVVLSGLSNPDILYRDGFTIKSIIVSIVGAWGKTGINCFVLLTGYFMCKQKASIKKFFNLLITVIFYDLIIELSFYIFGYKTFELKDFIINLIPIRSLDKGFMESYLIFYLFIPFLNIIVNSLKEKQHTVLLTICLSIFVLFETIPFLEIKNSYVTWFITIYLLASYIRNYPKEIYSKNKFWFLSTIISMTISIIVIIYSAWEGYKLNRFLSFQYMSDSSTFLAVINSINIFMLFRNLRIRQSKIINLLGSTTIGILCIHSHGGTMNDFLWGKLLNNVNVYNNNSNYLLIHIFLSVIAIYLVCSIIEVIRKCLFKDIYKLLNKDNKIDNFLLKIDNIYEM